MSIEQIVSFFSTLKLRTFYIKFAGDIFILTLLEISTIKFAGDIIFFIPLYCQKALSNFIHQKLCKVYVIMFSIQNHMMLVFFFKFNLPSQSKYFLVQIKFAGDVLALTVQCTFKSLKQWLQNHSSCQKHHVFTEPYFPLPACTKRHTHTHNWAHIKTHVTCHVLSQLGAYALPYNLKIKPL